MFLIDDAPVQYCDPWIAPLEDRIAQFYSGDQRVIYFYHHPDNSTFRYRIYNMLEALKLSPRRISGAYFTAAELDTLRSVVGSADVLVLCRARYSAALNEIINQAKRQGVRVLFDIDDLVFDPDYVHLVVDTLDQNSDHDATWDTWYSDFARHGAVLKLCDAAITTNIYLAQRLHSYASVPVSVIPNFLNRQQLAISEVVYQHKIRTGFSRDTRIHIGYFSGTPTHNKDFALVANAVVALLKTDPRVVLRVAGFLEIRGPLAECASQIEFLPFSDFLNLQRLIGAVEINLVPLQDNVFTNCKSELKYFEAGIVGTVSIATPTFTLSRAIVDNVNGCLARSWEWDQKLQQIIDSLGSHEYRRLAEAAFHDSAARYSPRAQVDLIESVLFDSSNMNRSGESEYKCATSDAGAGRQSDT